MAIGWTLTMSIIDTLDVALLTTFFFFMTHDLGREPVCLYGLKLSKISIRLGVFSWSSFTRQPNSLLVFVCFDISFQISKRYTTLLPNFVFHSESFCWLPQVKTLQLNSQQKRNKIKNLNPNSWCRLLPLIFKLNNWWLLYQACRWRGFQSLSYSREQILIQHKHDCGWNPSFL